jgi:hypothetical protein
MWIFFSYFFRSYSGILSSLRIPWARCLQEVESSQVHLWVRRINDQLLESQLCVSLVGKAYSLAVNDPEVLLLLYPQDGLKQVWVNSATAPVGVGNKPIQIPVVWWDVQSDTSSQQSNLSSR